MVVTVLSRRRIREFGKRHADAETELKAWFEIACRAVWKDLADVRLHFTDADQVGRVLVFNIRRNVYRLIVKVDYRSKLLMVKEILTHKEYNRKGWMKWY
jgi:mRNA interferase HigB